MTSKNSAEISVGFPIYGLRFINSKTLLAVGGGGEGNNGIPNKITALKCSFNAPEKSRRLQKFREITLPSNEDSPTCVDVCRSVDDDNIRYAIFVGCNQSTQLINTMNINNNLRKYVFTDEEHLQFSDAVQFDDSVSPGSVGEYPRIVHLSPESTFGAMMTSKVPSEIFIFNPKTLELVLRFQPETPSEIKDFHLNPFDEGRSLCFVTASRIEHIASSSGAILASSVKASKATTKTLAKYILSKVRFISPEKVVITASLRGGKGCALLEYDFSKQKITRERFISKKMKGIVAIDVAKATELIAVAGNDCSVSLIRISDLKIVKSFPDLHKFAITSLSFAPNGKRLATGSASNILNVVTIPPKIASSNSLIGTLFQYLLYTFLVAIFAIALQKSHESGHLDQFLSMSQKHGSKALVHIEHYARHYGKIGLELSQKYGDDYYHKAQHYGRIGYELLKDKSNEGLELLKEKLEKNKVDSTIQEAEEWVKEKVLTETMTTEPSIVPSMESSHDTSSAEPPAEKATETRINTDFTTTASTVKEDIVVEITRNVDEITAKSQNIDTESIIKEAVRQVTIVDAPGTPSGTIGVEKTLESSVSSLNVSDKSEVSDASELPQVLAAEDSSESNYTFSASHEDVYDDDANIGGSEPEQSSTNEGVPTEMSDSKDSHETILSTQDVTTESIPVSESVMESQIRDDLSIAPLKSATEGDNGAGSTETSEPILSSDNVTSPLPEGLDAESFPDIPMGGVSESSKQLTQNTALSLSSDNTTEPPAATTTGKLAETKISETPETELTETESSETESSKEAATESTETEPSETEPSETESTETESTETESTETESTEIEPAEMMSIETTNFDDESVTASIESQTPKSASTETSSTTFSAEITVEIEEPEALESSRSEPSNEDDFSTESETIESEQETTEASTVSPTPEPTPIAGIGTQLQESEAESALSEKQPQSIYQQEKLASPEAKNSANTDLHDEL
ncbi:putative guanine nucleotide-exchange factor [Clavispora lusitaniae]|uniref:Guanine nucleotide-exchange factor n=1 Tax=Clavispora lusitaniae TaxID=36911 RepID=A0ACD0WMH8_CLALS|nr:putative guanine nucleotide-exchange factor [Clavispora lusitaniae]QFZ34340.1 putative guanine nucleotide-exchange factor [Clavispora lusitaniae]QFZ40024.1 putative guanine nucleotide-exchange factor [Clavispora lusitaniae]QFZ45706.1 putative guanine nucleotide-exchange factor [Clavispora lusitaniae]QFZ51370.1 putative guanine nucleotide-exchange factor [Clavispora lusitaniae]